ncbi:MAG: hypothetical protein ACRDCN_12995 [Tannerellaceae bacterium]
MRNVLYYGLALFFTACNTLDYEPEKGMPEPNIPGKEYQVEISLEGELKKIEALSAEDDRNRDVFGVQIFRGVDTSDVYVEYERYGYGLFDDETKATLKLPTGYKYRFIASLVKEAKQKIYHEAFLDGEFGDLEAFEMPFALNNFDYGLLKNQFELKTETWLDYLDFGSSVMRDEETGDYAQSYMLPETDRYYGVTTDYVPRENEPAVILMNRAAFKTKFIAEGLAEGELMIAMQFAPVKFIKAIDTAREIEQINTFRSLEGCENVDEEFSESTQITFTWFVEGKPRSKPVKKTFNFERNKMHTIRIDVSETMSDSDIEQIIDSTPLSL